MIFVKTDKLKPGMRLAKPIYNKNGVLLYDRDTKLTLAGINSITNFGLIGIFILEDAEPLPPLTKEDIEFEQNQTIYMFQLQEIYDDLIRQRKPEKLTNIIIDIERKYGALDHRLNFNQNLRSSDDFIYKRSISVALLVAMITNHSQITATDREALICAALLYSIGYKNVPNELIQKGDALDEAEKNRIQVYMEQGIELLTPYRDEFAFFALALKIIKFYIFSFNPEKRANPDDAMKQLISILHTAIKFDEMTAMHIGHAPASDMKAMEKLKSQPDKFDPAIVDTLAESIHIIPHAANVDLSTGDKGIILVENPKDYMHPVVLRLSNNKIYDLSVPEVAAEIQIIDIMKTMDNRIAVDAETLKQFVPDSRLTELKNKFREKMTLASVRRQTSTQSNVDKMF